MAIPKMTEIVPQIKYGTMFLEELLVNVMRTPEVFALYVFSASVKFFDNTL